MLEFIRPYTPELVGLAARLRPGRRQLRRQRPLRAHPADLQRLPVHRQPGRRRADAGPAGQRFDGLQTGVSCERCPGAATPARPPTARRRSPTAATSADDCDPTLVLPGPMRRVARHRRCSSSPPRAVRRRRSAPASDGGAYKVRAIFDNAGFVIPGEDVKVAGVKVGTIDSLDVTTDFKAAVVLDDHDPGYQDFRADAECIVRPQSLIGEQLRRVRADAARAVGERAAAAAARRSTTGRARASTCCRSSTPSKSVDLDLLNDIMREPVAPAPVDHPQRARRRPRRPRRGPQRGHPARRPGAQGGRRGPQDPRRRRTRRCAGSPSTRDTITGAAGARAPPRRGCDRELERGRAGDRRAARRLEADIAEAAGVPAPS